MTSLPTLTSNLEDTKQQHLLCEYCHRAIILDPSFSKLTLRQYLNIQGLSSHSFGTNNHNGEDLEMLDPAELASMAQPVSYPALGVHDPTSASNSGAISAPGSLPTGAQCSTEPHPIATLPHEGNAVDAAARSLPPHPLQSQLLRDQPELLEAGITERARNMRVTSYMFDLLSKKTQIKHPLCEDCAEQLYMVKMDELKELEGECESYKELLLKLQQQRENDSSLDAPPTPATTSPESSRADEEELEALKLEEEKLLKELEQLQHEEATLRASEAAEERKLEALRAEDTRLLREYYAARRDVVELETEHLSVVNQLDAASEQLKRLNATNALNLAFHIAHEGDYGTINGLRLGRTSNKHAPPDAQVDWEEVNAAFGQAALLLHTLARKLNFTFERFRVVPFGNWSMIEELEQVANASSSKAPKVKSSLPLYHKQSRIFNSDDKFDKAVVCFSDCVWQLACRMKELDTSLEFPYRIVPERGRIEEAERTASRAPAAGTTAAHSAESSSSAAGGANETSYMLKSEKNERWSFAMRCLLALLKWMIAWIVARQQTSTVPGEQP